MSEYVPVLEYGIILTEWEKGRDRRMHMTKAWHLPVKGEEDASLQDIVHTIYASHYEGREKRVWLMNASVADWRNSWKESRAYVGELKIPYADWYAKGSILMEHALLEMMREYESGN